MRHRDGDGLGHRGFIRRTRQADAADVVGAALFQFQHQFRDVIGRILDVGVHPHHDRAVGCGNAPIQGCRRDLLRIVDQANKGTLPRSLLDEIPRSVVAHAVDDEHFQAFLWKVVGGNRLQATFDPLRLVATRDDDGYPRQFRQGCCRTGRVFRRVGRRVHLMSKRGLVGRRALGTDERCRRRERCPRRSSRFRDR